MTHLFLGGEPGPPKSLPSFKAAQGDLGHQRRRDLYHCARCGLRGGQRQGEAEDLRRLDLDHQLEVRVDFTNFSDSKDGQGWQVTDNIFRNHNVVEQNFAGVNQAWSSECFLPPPTPPYLSMAPRKSSEPHFLPSVSKPSYWLRQTHQLLTSWLEYLIPHPFSSPGMQSRHLNLLKPLIPGRR